MIPKYLGMFESAAISAGDWKQNKKTQKRQAQINQQHPTINGIVCQLKSGDELYRTQLEPSGFAKKFGLEKDNFLIIMNIGNIRIIIIDHRLIIQTCRGFRKNFNSIINNYN